MTPRLVLSDGQTILNGRAGVADGRMWMWLPWYTMQAASTIAFNPAATRSVTYYYGSDMDITYSGYTKCVNIINQGTEIAVCMEKGDDEDGL